MQEQRQTRRKKYFLSRTRDSNIDAFLRKRISKVCQGWNYSHRSLEATEATFSSRHLPRSPRLISPGAKSVARINQAPPLLLLLLLLPFHFRRLSTRDWKNERNERTVHVRMFVYDDQMQICRSVDDEKFNSWKFGIS